MERYGMVWFRSSWVSLMCGLLHGEWNEISTLFFLLFPFSRLFGMRLKNTRSKEQMIALPLFG